MKAKFVTYLLMVLTIMACQVLATDVYVENYSFELPGDLKNTSWNKVPGWDSDTIAQDSGAESAWPGSTDGEWSGFIYNQDPSVYNLTDFPIPDLSDVVYTLRVDAQDNTPTSGTPGVLKMSLFYDDSGTRVEVAFNEVEPTIYLNEPNWSEYSLTFNVEDVPESIGHNIGIEFENVTDISVNSWIGIDNVRLHVNLTEIVYPPNGAMHIPIDAVLEWALREGLNCDVYFGTQGDPNVTQNEKVVENAYETIHDPYGPEGLLGYGTTYYWRVDPIDPNQGAPIVYPGGTWSFTTMADEVTIITQPQSQTIPVTETAVFTVGAISPREISYSWRKVGEDEDELSDTDTFTWTNIQLDDEGYYYCILDDVKSTATTEPARLMTERLVGWWKLDGDLTDSVEEEVPGAPVHNGVAVDPNGFAVDPNYVDGVDQSGLEFFADDRLVVIPDTGEYFNFHPQGMTVSLWLNSETSGWDGIISKHLRDDVDGWVGWVIDLNGADNTEGWLGAAHFTLRGSHGDLFGNDIDGAMNDGQWYLFTAVVDPFTRTTRVYVNGVEKNESGTYNFGAIVMNDEPLVFGAEDQYGRVPYPGKIDDVRIWNYPLSAIDIALLYTDFNPGVSVCVNQDEPWMHFDVAGEPGESSYCKIDLEDFAELTAIWMKCNLVPDCLP